MPIQRPQPGHESTDRQPAPGSRQLPVVEPINDSALLIVTRNRADQLRLGLDSIARAKYDIHTVIVDDGSTDDTVAVCRPWIPQAMVIRLPDRKGYRRNPATVFNIGHVAAAAEKTIEQGGEVYHLTDCVTPLLDLCRPGVMALATCFSGTVTEMVKLRAMVDAGIAPPAEDVWVTRPETCGAKMPIPRRVIEGRRFEVYSGRERQAPFMFLGCTHVEDWNRLGGYDESDGVWNDQDYAERFMAHGGVFVFSGAAMAFHLEHGKS